MKLPPYQWLMGIACSSKSDRLLLLTTVGEKNQIWSVSADGAEQRKLIESDKGVTFSSPRWSADDDAVYFFREQKDTMELVKLPLFGGPPSHPFCSVALETGDYFTLSADGSELAYTREHHSSNLWSVSTATVGSATTLPAALTSGTLWYRNPSISPDGHSVAFTMGTETRGDVYTMSLDGGTPVQVTSVGDARTSSPAWSPDGSRIAYISDQGGTAKVWAVKCYGWNCPRPGSHRCFEYKLQAVMVSEYGDRL